MLLQVGPCDSTGLQDRVDDPAKHDDRPMPGGTDLFSLYIIFTLKSFSSNRNGSKPKLGSADLDTKESGSSGECKGGWPGRGQFLPLPPTPLPPQCKGLQIGASSQRSAGFQCEELGDPGTQQGPNSTSLSSKSSSEQAVMVEIVYQSRAGTQEGQRSFR